MSIFLNAERIIGGKFAIIPKIDQTLPLSLLEKGYLTHFAHNFLSTTGGKLYVFIRDLYVFGIFRPSLGRITLKNFKNLLWISIDISKSTNFKLIKI